MALTGLRLWPRGATAADVVALLTQADDGQAQRDNLTLDLRVDDH